MVICHGVVDFVRQFKIANKIAKTGYFIDGPVTIDEPNLFGGKKKEGGITGTLDVMMGLPTQTENAYLQSQLGSDIPAFRGVLSIVLNKMYLGASQYLKPWSIKVQRIKKTGRDGADQWYKAKAPIGAFSNTAVYIAIDISNSMDTVTGNGKTRLYNLKTAMESALTPLLGMPYTSSIDIMVVGFAGGTVTTTHRGISGTTVQTIIDWINARSSSDVTNGTTEFDLAFSHAESFFANSGNKERTSVFITDGAATGGTEVAAGVIFDSIEDLVGYGINIDLSDTTDTAYLDNTAFDGIPVASGGDPEDIESAVSNAIFSHFDMNPAHIIRECLTDRVWGMGYEASDMDDVSFTAAADTLYEEGLGISLIWDRQISIEEFINEIIKHIDAVVYVDPQTTKFVLKLMRNDYDVGTLITLDESNIDKISTPSRNVFGELVNSVTVVYWDHQKDEQASVVVHDAALVQMQNNEINTTTQYIGLSNRIAAVKVATRDLRTLSASLWSCTIYTNSVAKDLKLGDVFILSWDSYQMTGLVMRVMGIGYGNGKTNKIKITCVQDKFSVETDNTISIPEFDDGWTPLSTDAAAIEDRMVIEAPYYELVQILTQLDADAIITNNNDVGYLLIAASDPLASLVLNANLLTDAGAGYVDYSTIEMSPRATATPLIKKTDTVIAIYDAKRIDEVEIGSIAIINDEFVRVDAISSSEVTIARAVLDTVPQEHAADSSIIFWDGLSGSDGVEYVASDSIDVKLLTNTGSETLSEASAPADTIVMASRAVRPYAPQNFKLNAIAFPDYVLLADVAITFSHRDRLQQTSGDFFDTTYGDIGPEAGTTYSAELISSTPTTVWSTTGETSSPITIPLASIPAIGYYTLRLWAVRDGYDSFQVQEHEIYIGQILLAEDGTTLRAEDGTILLPE